MSQINPYNVDGTYPVAGQDNNSQGFRDNFTNIKNNLTFAKTEIEDLQGKVVLKSALTGTSLDNDFSGASISNATVQGFRNTKYDLGAVSGSVTVDFADGSFQTITTAGAVTISAIDNWPNASGTAVVLDLAVTVADATHTVTLPSAVSMTDSAGSSKTLSFHELGTYFFELISLDGGSSYYLVDKTRNYTTIQDDFTIFGNLTTYGAQVDNGFQYNNAPTSGATLAMDNNVHRLIFDASGTVANQTVTLPSANVANTVVTISSTVQITALKVQGSGGTTVKPNANVTLSAGTGVSYIYHSGESTWYKIS
jgi:hypothetical protein